MLRLLGAIAVGMIVVASCVACDTAATAGAGNVNVVLDPEAVQPGQPVRVTVNNCGRNTTASANSNAFGATEVTTSTGSGSVYTRVDVPASTPAGTYQVTAKCAVSGAKATTTLYVNDPNGAPVGAPATGGGGTATGPGAITVAGLGLAGLGVALGLIGRRRRRATVRG